MKKLLALIIAGSFAFAFPAFAEEAVDTEMEPVVEEVVTDIEVNPVTGEIVGTVATTEVEPDGDVITDIEPAAE